jgi:hypothetical protein
MRTELVTTLKVQVVVDAVQGQRMGRHVPHFAALAQNAQVGTPWRLWRSRTRLKQDTIAEWQRLLEIHQILLKRRFDECFGLDTIPPGLSGSVVIVLEVVVRRQIGYWMGVHREVNNPSPDWIFCPGIRKHVITFTVQIDEHHG